MDIAVAAGEADFHGLVAVRRDDGGRTWRSFDVPELTFLSWETGSGLWGLGTDGSVFVSSDGSGGWERRGEIGGRPAALLVTGGTAYAAVEGGDVLESADGGRTWSPRYDAR